MTALVTALVAVEYLYSPDWHEDLDGYLVREVKLFRITKRTPKRVFFDAGYGRTKSVDRERLERDGNVWVREFGGYFVYANRADAEPTPREEPKARVRRLRDEMAAVHPDRGGDPAEFRTAYARYQRAVASTREVTP